MIDVNVAVTREPGGAFLLERLSMQEPLPSEVVVRIVGVGICHTDLVARDQHIPVRLPMVLGHEGAGVVEKIGSAVSKVQVGDHVVLSFRACGACENCARGDVAYCANFAMLNLAGVREDGSATYRSVSGEPVFGNFFGQSSFGSHALVNEQNVVKIRRDVPLELMGPLGCGIQTGAGTVFNSLKARAGTTIVVFGVGPVGLSAVMAAKVAGCTQIIAVDLHESRLALSRELGATHTLSGKDEDLVEKLKGLSKGGVHYAIDSTGIPAVLRNAVESLRPSGVCALVGAPSAGAQVALDMGVLLMGRTIKGVIEGDSVPDTFIPYLIELWMQKKFPFDKLVQYFDLDQINEAVHGSERGAIIKPILRPSGCHC